MGFHCRIIVKAFHHDLIKIVVFDIFGGTGSRAGRWDIRLELCEMCILANVYDTAWFRLR